MPKSILTCLGIVFFSMVATSCLPATYTRETARLDAYVGGPINALVQDMGTPTLSARRDDGSWTYVWRGCRVVFDWHGRDISRYCEITALSDGQGIMRDWNWWGNECPLDGVPSGCGGLFWWQP